MTEDIRLGYDKDFNLIPNSLAWRQRALVDGYCDRKLDLDRVEFEKDIDESLKLVILVACADYYGSDKTLFSDFTFDFLSQKLFDRSKIDWRIGGSSWRPEGRTLRCVSLSLDIIDNHLRDEGLCLVHGNEQWNIFDTELKTFPRLAYEKIPTSFKTIKEMRTRK